MMETLAPWLPFIFGGILGFSILVYVILDGFDLGVGLLFPFATHAEKDVMVSSIGPFWDANETWLVLAVGILLVAFPAAHGTILTALYMPVVLMLLGLILRGVSFEFRAKAKPSQKPLWNGAFYAGSLLTALTQGWMLGLYIMGLEFTPFTLLFAGMTALLLTIGYSFIGATWLIHKTEGTLQAKAIAWAKGGLWGAAGGMALISLATPFVSPRLWEKWFSYPSIAYLSILPLLSVFLFYFLWRALRQMPYPHDRRSWLPFVLGTGLFLLAFLGMAYSFYPYVVPDKMTLVDAAAAPESLFIILWGAVVVVPIILAYSILSYWIFRGKAGVLRYD